MQDVKQIIIQDDVVPEKRILVQTGVNFAQMQTTTIAYDDLTQTEKDIYDAFVSMIKAR